MSTRREEILQNLANLMAAAFGFAEVRIDEPEPSRWDVLAPGGGGVQEWLHSCAVQDGPPPDHLGFVRGGGSDLDSDELELEAVVAYAVQVGAGAGQSTDAVRARRRDLRDIGVRIIAAAIAQDPTLGIAPDVYADVRPAARDDDVAFANATPSATALVPIRVLYTAGNAAG